MEKNNTLLSKIGIELRRPRALVEESYHYYNRVEPSKGGNYVEVWFRTRGCRHDYGGGCTMCNYGVSTPVQVETMVSYVEEALTAIDVPVLELLVSPSGSMLDPWEVPPRTRRQIYELVDKFPCENFVVETRAETVDEARACELAASIKDKHLGIELGLESSDPWILKFCVNKCMDVEEHTAAVEVMKKHNIRSYANISLGTAFLSEREAIQDALNTALWAFAQGTDVSVVFPLHIKPYTLLYWLWEHNMYSPPSLWSLVEVLKQLGPDRCSRTEISWYKSYYKEDYWISCSPTTCPRCIDTVMPLLDLYRDMQSYDVVLKLDEFDCDCHTRWREQLHSYPTTSLFERVTGMYETISPMIFGQEWWKKNRERMMRDILASHSEVPKWASI